MKHRGQRLQTVQLTKCAGCVTSPEHRRPRLLATRNGYRHSTTIGELTGEARTQGIWLTGKVLIANAQVLQLINRPATSQPNGNEGVYDLSGRPSVLHVC